ncbi:Fic family protein [Conservatibacter flavescens]|uniref:DUF4172 domain-containing protein n=1 Tax=Conservatibacter flavescens TaxID=28161 RepID=A0A2M8S017_9PAST|nr:Fic family protein [Conservatibacter flavescens]PJG84487.1 DUF4172 domain-containing protein [Conservatibacter flavescens]
MNEKYIWQQKNWTAFQWDNTQLADKLRRCWKLLGELIGQTEKEDDNVLDVLLSNIIHSSAIEGEQLNGQAVRSSLAKRLGISLAQPYPVSERSEGVANILFDALENRQHPLTLSRLLQWHEWLFPTQGLQLVRVGALRGNEPMQVVSGRIDRPTVHFEAPPREILENELDRFIHWFNQSRHDVELDPLLRAGICHLWLLTLHPFDDGNGRLTRALTDMALAQAEQQSVRLYSISSAIFHQRNRYYQMLETAQKGERDITLWLNYFLDLLTEAVLQSLHKIRATIKRTQFWVKNAHLDLAEGQKKVLNRLLESGENNFEHGINASQYQKVAKVSKATATRHLADLTAKELLIRSDSGGRSTRYVINTP